MQNQRNIAQAKKSTFTNQLTPTTPNRHSFSVCVSSKSSVCFVFVFRLSQHAKAVVGSTKTAGRTQNLPLRADASGALQSKLQSSGAQRHRRGRQFCESQVLGRSLRELFREKSSLRVPRGARTKNVGAPRPRASARTAPVCCGASAATGTVGRRRSQVPVPATWISAPAGSVRRPRRTVRTVFSCVASRDRKKETLAKKKQPSCAERPGPGLPPPRLRYVV